MLVYGGIDNNETKNTVFYYDTENNQWFSPQCVSTGGNNCVPALSHHKMVAVPMKQKRKAVSQCMGNMNSNMNNNINLSINNNNNSLCF